MSIDGKKRVLWLLNHKTLRDFECNLLENLGYEVYTAKKFPPETSFTSGSVDFSYDENLTIKDSDLQILNTIDFYKYIPPIAFSIINKYFDLAFIHFSYNMLNAFVSKYEGHIILRAFGIISSYEKILMSYRDYALFDKIEQIKNRFWFGEGYDNLHEIEEFVLRQRAIYLPIGMKDAIVSDQWRGEKKRILFICREISTNEHYAEIYKDFLHNFKDFNYIIGGHQSLPVEDPNVVGFLSREDYIDMYINSRVMFYEATNKRRVHYHPFEAVKCGLPLVFMGGGLLDKLGGRNLPGRCSTLKEAKHKIGRILEGDTHLIESIRSSQSILLRELSYEHCFPHWKKNLLFIESVARDSRVRMKKIAVILPAPYKGGTLDYSILLAKCLKKGFSPDGKGIQIVFGYPDSPIYEKRDFSSLEQAGILLRPFDWKSLSLHDWEKAVSLRGFPSPLALSDNYVAPDDGLNYFGDCDCLIFTTDRIAEGEIALFKPYIVCVHDYIQRYLPELFGSFFERNILEFQRGAAAVLVTTIGTEEDAVGYGGISRDKVRRIPLFLDETHDEYERTTDLEHGNEGYFLWTTNTAPHKMHSFVLDAISEYYEKGGLLKCVVTGVNTNLFDVDDKDIEKELEASGESLGYVQRIRNRIKRDKTLRSNVLFCGNLSRRGYLQRLSNARFLLHSALYDNGSFSALDAASMKVPTLSSDYPNMRFLCNHFGIKAKFYDIDVPDSLLNALFQMEGDAVELRKQLPTKEQLHNLSIKYTYTEVCNIIKETFFF